MIRLINAFTRLITNGRAGSLADGFMAGLAFGTISAAVAGPGWALGAAFVVNALVWWEEKRKCKP